MEFKPARLPGVVRILPRIFDDARGSFLETWQKRKFEEAGITADFVQANHSRSHYGVLRGLHFQNPNAQGKLVRVTSGKAFDVVVDLRRGSESFGHWEGFRLDAERHEMLWIPTGFAHGFLALSDVADFVYMVTDYWAPESEHTLCWNDPDVGVEWPLAESEIILNDKDRAGGRLVECETFE